jgi:hypothetical protein
MGEARPPVIERYGYKPRHNFVYLSADLSQSYRFIITT